MICSKENGSELFIDGDDRLLDYDDSSEFKLVMLNIESKIISDILNRHQMIWRLPYSTELEYDEDPNFACKSADSIKDNDLTDSEDLLKNVGITK